MNPQYGHSNNPRRRDPLGHNYEFALHKLDAQLDELAARDELPAGLADRIYEASVRMLPGAEIRAAQRTRLRLASIGERPRRRSVFVVHRTTWGRLAAAASLALACGAALWFSTANPIRIAQRDQPQPATDMTNGEFMLAGWLPMDSISEYERELAYLETDDINDVDVLGEATRLAGGARLR